MSQPRKPILPNVLASKGADKELALIVGAARSGTTLLRLLLDAHPEIGCPAEAGLPSLMSHMAGVWATVDADTRAEAPATDPGQQGPDDLEGGLMAVDQTDRDHLAPDATSGTPMPDSAREWIRATTMIVMQRYCNRGDKRLYVDKSLDSVHYLGLVRQVFPNARYVLAFRHVMDTVASGIEASPWGFQAYGYAPYVHVSPANTVAALAKYWLDHVDQALAWETQHPETCLRVRYEDLVANPETTVREIQDFLAVRNDISVLQRAFDREPARGPGDYKIEYTTAVHSTSVGHGKRVPVGMLPPPLLSAINEKLEALGYPPLGRSWNASERAVDTRVDNVWSQRLRNLMSQAKRLNTDLDAGVFAVVAEDDQSLRWIIDSEMGTITQGDGDVEAVLTGTAEDLVLAITGEENLGVLLRAGRIRHVVPDEDVDIGRDRRKDLTLALATLRSSLPNVP
jgi:hypothetical protein